MGCRDLHLVTFYFIHKLQDNAFVFSGESEWPYSKALKMRDDGLQNPLSLGSQAASKDQPCVKISLLTRL